MPVTQTLPFICLFCSLSFGTIEKIAYLCSTNSIGLCTCYIKVRAVGRLPFLLSIVEEQARERERAKARIVFFILPVVQTLPLICLFCLLSFGTIEKIAYLCSVVNKPSLLMRFSYLKVKAVGRLPFLLSIVETRAKNEGTKRTEIGDKRGRLSFRGQFRGQPCNTSFWNVKEKKTK